MFFKLARFPILPHIPEYYLYLGNVPQVGSPDSHNESILVHFFLNIRPKIIKKLGSVCVEAQLSTSEI